MMRLILIVSILFLVPIVARAFCETTDPDQDGIENDNCPSVANTEQGDADRDGWGNRCDADYDQTGRVGITDLATIRACFGLTETDAEWPLCRIADHDEDGAVGLADFAIFRACFGQEVPCTD